MPRAHLLGHTGALHFLVVPSRTLSDFDEEQDVLRAQQPLGVEVLLTSNCTGCSAIPALVVFQEVGSRAATDLEDVLAHQLDPIGALPPPYGENNPSIQVG